MSAACGVRRVILAGAALAVLPAAAAAVEGVRGTVWRPAPVPAKVDGCRVARGGTLTVRPGDRVELDYTYPVAPGCVPAKVSVELPADAGWLRCDGVRAVRTGLLGSNTLAAVLEARGPGAGEVRLRIDGNEYVYAIRVEG